MLDDLSRREPAGPPASSHVPPAREPGEEAGGEDVARAGRIDELGDREGGTSQVSSPSTTTQPFFRPRDGAEHPLCGGYCR